MSFLLNTLVDFIKKIFINDLDMPEGMTLMKQGAEAKIYKCIYLGKPTVIKERFSKNYRHPDIDASLTKERTTNEARSLLRCILADVKTPALYLVDFSRNRIYLEYFEHCITVKDYLMNVVGKGENKTNQLLSFIAKAIGVVVRKMHDNKLIHSDLTTSNMLLVEKEPTKAREDVKWLNEDNLELVMIDFGLSYVDSSAEDKGMDLYVLERALISTHNNYPNLFQEILEHYINFSRSSVKEVLNKFEEVRRRGRKRSMIG